MKILIVIVIVIVLAVVMFVTHPQPAKQQPTGGVVPTLHNVKFPLQGTSPHLQGN